MKLTYLLILYLLTRNKKKPNKLLTNKINRLPVKTKIPNKPVLLTPPILLTLFVELILKPIVTDTRNGKPVYIGVSYLLENHPRTL